MTFEKLLHRIMSASKVYRPISSASLEAGLNGEPIGDALIVTFDDGLAEQSVTALRLADLGIPSICFVPTLPIINGELLDVHRIHLIRSIASDQQIFHDLKALFGNSFSKLDIQKARAQYAYDDDIARQIKFFLNVVLSEEDRRNWTKISFAKYCGDERAAAKALYMNVDTIKSLGKRGLVGCHGHSHLALAQQKPKAQKADLSQAQQILREIIGPGRIGLAYPYGGPDAATSETFSIAEELRFAFAFTMRRGVNDWSYARKHPFSLARIDTNDVSRFI